MSTTTAELAQRIVRQHAAAFAERAPRAAGGSDPEDVHQARVAIRRLRAALRVFGEVLSAEVKNLEPELQWVAAQLGPVRDLDVQIERTRKVATVLGVTEVLVPYGAWLEEQRQRALAAFADASRSERFIELTEQLRRLAEDDVTTDDQSDATLVAAAKLRESYRKLRKRAQDLRVDSPPLAFHKARIRAKRLRYITEFFADLYGKPAQRLIASATALQDLLGDHQDGVVSGQRIHEAVQTAAGAWPAETSLALGRVVEWETQNGKRLRRKAKPTYREVADAWRRVRRVR